MTIQEEKFLKKELIIYDRIYKALKKDLSTDVSGIEKELKQLRDKYERKKMIEHYSNVVEELNSLDLKELTLRAERLIDYYNKSGIRFFIKNKLNYESYFLLKVYKKRVGCDKFTFFRKICYFK